MRSGSELELEFQKNNMNYYLQVEFRKHTERGKPEVDILSVVDENENETDPDIFAGELNDDDWNAISRMCQEMTR